jgi:hypothetical protein
LAKLESAGLLGRERQGRNHYFRLANEQVASFLEAALFLAADLPVKPLRCGPADGPLGRARCCWGHLAGRLGVLLTDRLVASGEIVRSNEKFVICSAPRLLPRIFGQARSQFSAGKVCLDWSERRPHIGGALGRALFAALLERKWLERVPSSRVVTITVSGRRELQEIVGPVDFDQTP